MIELNLLEKRQSFKLPVIAGIDLNKISIPKIIVAIIFYNVSASYLLSYYNEQIAKEEQAATKTRESNSRLTKEIKSQEEGRKELEAYFEQVQKAKVRSLQINEILKTRTNPKKVLEVIGRTIPDDVSFESLSIDVEDNISIVGESFNSRAIGDFIAIINDTPYFGGSITPVKQENKETEIEGVMTRIDTFELKGKIKNYDMRLK